MNDEKLKELFSCLEFDRDETEAKAYGLTMVDGIPLIKQLGSAPDIYAMLDDLDSDKRVQNSRFDYFTLITHGWAAPLDKDGEIDGRPSAHPKKRRVRLIIAVDLNDEYEIGSVVQFSDDPDELLCDHGNATGALAEAVAGLFV